MRYTVIWVPKAEQDLAEIWMNAANRNAITSAAGEIDQRLRINPDQQGESRPQGRRMLLVPPLGVVFKVQPEDRIVYVRAVWRFEKRRRGS